MKQKEKLRFLQKVLEKLLELDKKFESGKIKFIELNGKIYKKINFSSYQLENALKEYVYLGNKKLIVKANTIVTQSPYKEALEEAKLVAAKNRGSNLIDPESLQFEDLKYRFGVLAADNERFKNRIKMLETFIKEKELNKEPNECEANVLVDESVKKANQLFADLIDLCTQENLLQLQPSGSDYEIFFEGDYVNSKLCNLSSLSRVSVQLNEDKKLVPEKTINFKE